VLKTDRSESQIDASYSVDFAS